MDHESWDQWDPIEELHLHRYHQSQEGSRDGRNEKGTGLCSAECNGHEEEYAAEGATGDRKVTIEELFVWEG